jgi:hypothetical protein
MSWWEILMDFYPMTLTAWFTAINGIAALLFSRRKRPKQLFVALVVTTVVLYAVPFWTSGFGWGWAHLTDREALLMRVAMGANIGFNAALFAWIVSGRLRWMMAVPLIALNAPLFLAEPSEHSRLEVITSTIVVLVCQMYWYRDAPKSGPSHLPAANL